MPKQSVYCRTMFQFLQVSPSCFTEMDEGETQPEIIAIDGYLAPPAAHGGMVPPSNGDATRPRLTSTSRRLSFGRAATQMSQQDQELAEKRQKEAQSRAEQYERERVAAEEISTRIVQVHNFMETTCRVNAKIDYGSLLTQKLLRN